MKKSTKIIIAIASFCVLAVGGFFGYRFYQQNKNGQNAVEDNKPEIEEIDFVTVSEADALSEKEWMELLNESLQYTDYTEYSDDKTTGSQAVFTGLKKLGGPCLDYYLDGKEYTEDNTDAIAKDKKLIEEDYLDSYIGKEQAEVLIDNLKTLYVLENYHVEKNDVVLADGVVDGKEWKVDYYQHIEEEVEETVEQKDEVIAYTGDYEPQIDDKIIYLDQYGIMHGGKIVAVKAVDNKFDILTIPVGTQEELVDTYTVAGYVDWSIVRKMNSKDSAFNPTISMCTSSEGSQESTTTDMIISGSGSADGISVDEVTLGGITIFEAEDEEDEDEEEEESEDDDKAVSVEGSVSGNFEIALNDLQIYAYVKDDEDVSFEISFEPTVTIEGIAEAGVEIDIPNIPLAIGVLSAEINPSIAISADLELTLELGAEQPVFVSSHSDPSGTSKSCNENSVTCKLGNADSIDSHVDNANITLGFNLGLDLSLCEFINVADPTVTASFVSVGKQLAKQKGYDVPCFEMKLAGPIIELDLSSEESLLGYFLTEASVQSSFALNNIDEDDKLLVAKYYHIEFEPVDIIQDPNGNASVCTHYSGELDHSKDIKIRFDDIEEETQDEEAEFYIEINGKVFGFEFTSEEDKQQYLDYLDNLDKDAYMNGSAKTLQLKPSIDYVFSLYDVDNPEEYEEFSCGDYYLEYGTEDFSKLDTVYPGPDGIGTSGYVRGHVIGHVTKNDKARFDKLVRPFRVGDYITFRNPYKNLAK